MSVAQTTAKRNRIATNPTAGAGRRIGGGNSGTAAQPPPAGSQSINANARSFARTTSRAHSHRTIEAATTQNTTKKNPPRYATITASGASTSDEITRRVRSLRAGALAFAGSGVAKSLRSGLGDEPAKAPLAPAVFFDRGLKGRTIKVVPIDRREHKLRIGCLPEQEVREPLFSRGADDEIGIRNIGRVEILADHVLRDRLGL